MGGGGETPALPPPSLTAYLVPGEPAAGDPIWGKPTPAHSSQERVDVGEKLGVLPASVPTTYSGQGGGSRFGLLLFWWLRRRRRQENSQSRLSPKPAAQSREGPPRSQVRWLPLSVFQGCGRWALTVLPLHPNSFPKIPSSSRGTWSEKQILAIAEVPSFQVEKPRARPSQSGPSSQSLLPSHCCHQIYCASCHLSPCSATPSVGTGYRRLALEPENQFTSGHSHTEVLGKRSRP